MESGIIATASGVLNSSVVTSLHGVELAHRSPQLSSEIGSAPVLFPEHHQATAGLAWTELHIHGTVLYGWGILGWPTVSNRMLMNAYL